MFDGSRWFFFIANDCCCHWNCVICVLFEWKHWCSLRGFFSFLAFLYVFFFAVAELFIRRFWVPELWPATQFPKSCVVVFSPCTTLAGRNEAHFGLLFVSRSKKFQDNFVTEHFYMKHRCRWWERTSNKAAFGRRQIIAWCNPVRWWLLRHFCRWHVFCVLSRDDHLAQIPLQKYEVELVLLLNTWIFSSIRLWVMFFSKQQRNFVAVSWVSQLCHGRSPGSISFLVFCLLASA